MQVVLTGGGTGGHVIPNVAVIDGIREKYPNIKISYIGSTNGVEKKIIKGVNVKYYGVPCGKLRRYLSFKNFIDFFKIPVGIVKSAVILRKLKPNIVFSKGGYVSLHVVIAASILKIPVITHESDLSVGLANRISARFADKICISFDETAKKIAEKYRKKIIKTGTPIRKSILNGNKKKGYKFTKLNNKKPIILIMGGSLGAKQINNLITNAVVKILTTYQIVHLTGKNNRTGIQKEGYSQFEFVSDELNDIYAISDIVITRGGANSLFEMALLGKKVICIPISHDGSRGEQVDNAKYFVEKLGWKMLVGNISADTLVNTIKTISKTTPQEYTQNGTDKIIELIKSYDK